MTYEVSVLRPGWVDDGCNDAKREPAPRYLPSQREPVTQNQINSLSHGSTSPPRAADGYCRQFLGRLSGPAKPSSFTSLWQDFYSPLSEPWDVSATSRAIPHL